MRVSLRLKNVLTILAGQVLSLLIPRTSQIVVFGGSAGKRFADNSRYFFQWYSGNSRKRCVWLTHDKDVLHLVQGLGYEAYLAHSVTGLWLGFRAKWHVVDVSRADTSDCSSVGAHILNLWHGVPIKNLEAMYGSSRTKRVLQYAKRFIFRSGLRNQRSFMVFPNYKFRIQFVRTFNLMIDNIIISNQPRNAVMGSDKFDELLLSHERSLRSSLLQRKGTGQLIGYFPTWRPDGTENFFGGLSVKQAKDLNEQLLAHGSFIVFKRHSCSFEKYGHSGMSESASATQGLLEGLSNFIALDFNVDLNSVLDCCDLLISDYSGAIIDYLLLNRPIILYCYDLSSYKRSPGLYFDYDEYKFGKVVADLTELFTEIKQFSLNPVEYSLAAMKERAKLRDMFFEQESCFERIAQVIDRN